MLNGALKSSSLNEMLSAVGKGDWSRWVSSRRPVRAPSGGVCAVGEGRLLQSAPGLPKFSLQSTAWSFVLSGSHHKAS